MNTAAFFAFLLATASISQAQLPAVPGLPGLPALNTCVKACLDALGECHIEVCPSAGVLGISLNVCARLSLTLGLGLCVNLCVGQQGGGNNGTTVALPITTPALPGTGSTLPAGTTAAGSAATSPASLAVTTASLPVSVPITTGLPVTTPAVTLPGVGKK